MKTVLKKSVSLLLAAVMLCFVAPFWGVVFDAEAAAYSGACGENVTWSIADGVLTVSGEGAMADYTDGEDTPWYLHKSEINSVVVENGVTAVGDNAFYGLEISEVTVSATVEEIGTNAFGWCIYLEKIIVASENKNYASGADGVLYNADKTVLVKYPSGRKAVSFDIPETVTSLADYAFENCYILSDVNLPASLADIGYGAFFNSFLENINVDAQNADYSSLNGVLFNKDQSVLISYPANNSRKNYSVPYGVKSIDAGAFHNNYVLEGIVIPESVTTLGDEVFLYCESLEFLHVSEKLSEIGEAVIDEASAYICADTETCYAKEYADLNGYTFVVCDGHGVSDIFLSETEISIKNQKTLTLVATVIPDTANDKTVSWTSDNEDVATVDQNGIVTAVSVGTANITVTANNGGKTATCKVTVTPRTYKITWVFLNGSQTKYAEEGSAIVIPSVNPVPGYTFNGWAPQIPDAMPAEDMTFTAQFIINSYDAVFYAEGGKWADGDYEKTVSTVYQSEVSAPDSPERKGYEFAGWTPQVPDSMPARRLEFSATWTPVSYDAVFDANGGKWTDGETRKTVPTNFDSQIIAPADPEMQGYVFNGWSPEVGIMNDVNGKKYTAEWVPANDTKYTVETYTMEIGGEYTVRTVTLNGTTDSEVEAEYTVETGFVLNEEMSILSGVVAADGSLVLKVYFDRVRSVISVNGANVECWFGETISEPEKPEAPEGYVQSGWVDENGDAVEFPLVLNEDFPKEIKANFVLNSFTVRWNVDGEINEETYTYQSAIVKPADPEKEGYIFKGWTPDVPDAMPAYDIEFTAVFERIVYRCTDCDFETYDEDEYKAHMAYEQSKKDVRILIKNNPGTAEIKYGETLKLTATTTIDIEGTRIFWFVDGVKKGEGDTFSITFEKGTKKIEAKIADEDGKILEDEDGNEISDSQNVTVKSGFWQKIVSFFKNLFGMNRTIIQMLSK